MGFYEKYFSTILRGPFSLKWKERIGVNAIERLGGRLEKDEGKTKKEAEETHEITNFLSTKKKDVTYIRRIADNCFSLLFNELLQDRTELNEMELFFKELANLPLDRRLREVEYKVVGMIISVLKHESASDRQEYRELEAVMNQATKFKTNREGFMIWLRTQLKTKVTLRNILEKVSWKMSISAASRNISRTKKAAVDLRKMVRGINIAMTQESDKKEELIQALEQKLVEEEQHIADMFKESYLVKERALLMILKILYTAENMDLYLQDLVKRNYIPKEPADKLREELANAVETLGKHLHNVIAQEFRIVIQQVELEKKHVGQLARVA